MYRVIQISSFAIVSVCIVACSKSSPAKVSVANAPKPNITRKYSAAVNLHIAHDYEDLRNIKSNLVTLTGHGPNSTYSITYKFNSGSAQRFELLSASRSAETSGRCGIYQTHMRLVGRSRTQKISVGEMVNLNPNSKYMLQVDFDQNCKSSNVSYDVLAWVGSPTVDPELAVACNGKTVITNDMLDSKHTTSSAVFFPEGIVTGFLSIPVGHAYRKYTSMHTYCGEHINTDYVDCMQTRGGEPSTASANPFNNSFGVTCSGGKKQAPASYTLNYNSRTGAASLKCNSGYAPDVLLQFFSCQPIIANRNLYY